MKNKEEFIGFFSYSHFDANVDGKIIRSIVQSLELRVTVKIVNARFSVWQDIKNLRTGDIWNNKIEDAIKNSHILFILITPKWYESEHCLREYDVFKGFVEGGLDTRDYIYPLLFRDLGGEVAFMNRKQLDVRDDIEKRQYRRASSVDFLNASKGKFGRLMDEMADEVVEMIQKIRSPFALQKSAMAELAPDIASNDGQNASQTVSQDQLQVILPTRDPEYYYWWQKGLAQATSVGAICDYSRRRFGTAFLVRAGDFGLLPKDELLVLTNYHVVNDEGATGALSPEEVEIIFEALDSNRAYKVKEIVWSSPINRHDASLLRLTEAVGGQPLEIAPRLPPFDARIHIIGHPWGDRLSFSIEGSKLLDHEGAPEGKPQIPGVCRVHYSGDVAVGSSGSPVFDHQWRLIAIHHMGSRDSMPKLNGRDGRYGANEGIAITSIQAAIRSELRSSST